MPSKPAYDVGQNVWLDGRDPEAQPPLTLRQINLWDGVPRRTVQARLQHGTRCVIVASQWCIQEKRWYYYLRCRFLRGWVPAPFLCADKPPVLGDLVK